MTRRTLSLFGRMSRIARQPSAAEIAAMPFAAPDEPIDEEAQAARQLAYAMTLPNRVALIARSTEAGEVVAGMTPRQLNALRSEGVIQPDRLFLTPFGRKVRALVAARERGRA